ncbi:MAG: type II secretion system protein GspN [Spirochaetes bacterium]|jgi:hypothetical protein|nr:type II secretion system protein GspN [Spirochaetota bacterium]
MKNISIILNRIKTSIQTFLKTTIQQSGFKRFCFTGVILTIIFTAMTFPYDKLILNQLKSLEGKSLQTISLPGFSFSVFGNAGSDSFIATLKNGSTISSDKISLKTSPSAFLISSKLKTNFSISNCMFENSDNAFKGSINGSTDIIINRQNSMPSSGNIQLTIRNASLNGIKITGFSVPDITFNQIKGDITISDYTATFNKTIFNGPDLNGTIAGSIGLNEKGFAMSRLNLTIDINANSGLLEAYRMLITSYLNPATNSLRISLGGTVANPDIKFIK